MASIDVTFELPAKIAAGLAEKTLIRNGGVIQDKDGQILMWLRDISDTQNLDMSGTSGILSLLGAGSALSLGISALGIAAIAARIKSIEEELKESQRLLGVINQKIDIGIFANFRAALDLARNSFSMAKESNRHGSALQAINRFLEVEHIYSDLLRTELEAKSSVCGKYLLTLSLAYLAEIRCYLELGEYETALRRFQESKPSIQKYIDEYIDILLTDEPIIYFHPQLGDSINLSRLTKVIQWKEPSADENLVFGAARDYLFNPVHWSFEDKIKALPQAITGPYIIERGFWGMSNEGMKIIFEQLSQAFGEIESMIETNSRFASYEYELKLLTKSNISLQKWEAIKPKEPAPEGSSVMYIVPEIPVMLDK